MHALHTNFESIVETFKISVGGQTRNGLRARIGFRSNRRDVIFRRCCHYSLEALFFMQFVLVFAATNMLIPPFWFLLQIVDFEQLETFCIQGVIAVATREG